MLRSFIYLILSLSIERFEIDTKNTKMIQTIKKILAVLIIIFLLPCLFIAFMFFTSDYFLIQPTPNEDTPENWEVDAEGTAYHIVDGDTFDVNNIGRIRLADINSPDKGETGYNSAKNYLTTLIYDKFIYLDIDDVYETDDYNRIIAVVYVRYNATHLLNVNKHLLDQGYATIWDFNNEFTPTDWLLYVRLLA